MESILGLTLEQVENEFTFIGKTPAYGLHYISEELDICVIVYRHYFKVFWERQFEGNYAACFKNVEYVNKEK